MNFDLPEELKVIREATRKFAEKELLPISQRMEETKKIPPAIIAQMKELGYFGAVIPAEYGGLGLSNVGYCLIQEELARANLAFVMLISGNNGIGSLGILYFGNEAQKQKYLPRSASGEIITCFALTEPGAGSDAAAISTKAEKKGDKYILNGMKHYITRADISDVFTVIAVTDKEKRQKGGFSAFILDKDAPGFKIGKLQDSMGSDILRQCEMIFEDCEIPAENLLGKEGDGWKVAMRVLEEGRLGQGARACGIARRLIELCVDHANQRVQFGKPIAANQAVQWMLADMAVELYAMQTMTYDAAWRLDQGDRTQARASKVKLFATEAVNRIADRAVQIFGGMGYMREAPIESIYREVRGMRIYEGTSEIQRMIISRDVLNK